MIWTDRTAAMDLVYDSDARTVTSVPAPHLAGKFRVMERPMTVDEEVGLWAIGADEVRNARRVELTELSAIQARLEALRALFALPAVRAFRARPHPDSTALTTEQLNQLLKRILDHVELLSRTAARGIRLERDDLLDDITDA